MHTHTAFFTSNLFWVVKSKAHTLSPTVMKSAAITVSIGTISFAANSTNIIRYIKNKWFDELDKERSDVEYVLYK
mgnify:CR=1 FL=1